MTSADFSERAGISRRAYLGAISVGSITPMAGCVQYIRSNNVEGLVGAKSIIGRRDDLSQQIMVVHDIALLVKDHEFDGRFGEKTSVTVDEALRRDLELAYWDGIQYQIQTHLLSDDLVNRVDAGRAASYLVSRRLFNEVQVGNTVSFTVSRTTPLQVREYTEITSS